MSLLLQTNELSQDFYWIIGALIVLIIVFFYTRSAQVSQRNKRIGKFDPRQKVVNDSSYNINREGIDGHRTDVDNAEEARAVADKLKETGTIPTGEEHHDLTDEMNKDDKA